MSQIVLVRHAQSEGNVRGVFSGRDDPPLSAAGIAQAEATAIALAQRAPRIERIWSSPAARAFDTASVIASRLGLGDSVEISGDLREMDYGEWEGKKIASVASPRELGQLFSDPAFAPPAGESVLNLCTRVWRVLEEEIDRTAGTSTLVVSHLGPVKAGIIWSLGSPPECFPRIRVDNASISEVRVSPSAKYLVSANETSHLQQN